MKRFFLIFAFVLVLLSPNEGRAVSKDVKNVATISLYGLAAGTVLGLASVPFTQSARGIFLGSSIGLYTGIIIGFYYITSKDDPTNPLRSQSLTSPSQMASLGVQSPALLKVDYPVLRF